MPRARGRGGFAHPQPFGPSLSKRPPASTSSARMGWGCCALIVSVLAGPGALAAAQDRVWRCGNEYTNDAALAKQRGCKAVEGGNVTVVQGSRLAPSAASSGAAASPASGPRVDGAEQRARDAEARSVLEAELKKARERRARLLEDYNGGEPEKQGGEARSYQKYLDRVADMKAEIARNESDIAGLQRELGRLPPATDR